MTIKKHPVRIIQTGDSFIPFHIKEIRTKSVRFRFNSKGGSINLPPYLSSSNKRAFIEKGEDWILRYVDKNPHWLTVFSNKRYKTGAKISTNLKDYTIDRISEKTNSIAAKLDTDRIYLSAPDCPSTFFQELEVVRKSLHKVIAKDIKKELDLLIRAINEETLRVNINKIHIKYNHSNWGSCSSNGNINISSRLLFAPRWVIESVIKHELAHFKEMNHSSKFWDIIQSIDHSHKEANSWLKANSWTCNF